MKGNTKEQGFVDELLVIIVSLVVAWVYLFLVGGFMNPEYIECQKRADKTNSEMYYGELSGCHITKKVAPTGGLNE